MPRRTDSRDRMLATAVDLFRRQGYHATAFSQVVAESGAPRGSIYYHFPGGKEELAVAAVALGVEEADAVVDAAVAQAADAPDFVRVFTGMVGERLETSGYRAGCAIATMVLELAPDVEAMGPGFDRVFARWRAATASAFEGYGYEPERAAALGTLLVSALEGALILARSARSLEPLQTTSDALLSMLEPPRAGRRRRSVVRPDR